MQSAPDHPQEQQRLDKLLGYQVLDSADEQAFDELTELASTICGTPISLISLVDNHRQWFKSRVGLDATETPKNIAFCSHAILQSGVFEVPNALEDPRFADNPLVTGAPDIRFYAGSPLVAPDGSPIGTLCVIDREPRKLKAEQQRALDILAHQVIGQLELRLHNRQLERQNREQKAMIATIAHDLRSPFNAILGLARRLSDKAEELPTEKVVKAANSVLTSSLSVYQLLDEMIQWSTRRYCGNNLEVKPLPVKALVEISGELLGEALQLKNIAYSTDIDDELEVRADPTLIKSVIRNLLNNAIKFTPEQGRITIKAHARNKNIELRVFNSGKQVPQKLREKLFVCGVESDDGTQGEKGHGLGLRLCHEFMTMQNGTIQLDEKETEGAMFILTLPAPEE